MSSSTARSSDCLAWNSSPASGTVHWRMKDRAARVCGAGDCLGEERGHDDLAPLGLRFNERAAGQHRIIQMG